MKRAFWISLVAGPALVATALAQVPGVPVGPVAAPAPKGILGLFPRSAEQKAACKTAFCASAIGQMVNSMAGPVSAMSGGLIRNRCALNAIEEGLKKDPAGAEGAAARIKKEEAEAQARREAVRYLGTVDCNYRPEAADVLIKALRADTSECVRFEAALAFQSGCCCTKKVIEALAVSASGSDRDNNPPENSDRVRAAAADALSHCVSVHEGPSSAPEIQKNGEKKLTWKTDGGDPSEYYKKISKMPREEVVEMARRSLEEARIPNSAAGTGPISAAVGANPARPGSVAAIFSAAFTPRARATLPAGEEAAPSSAAIAAEPKAVNAHLTSRSSATEPSATSADLGHIPAMASPATTTAPAERRPFFDNLTRALKGKQTSSRTTGSVDWSATNGVPVNGVPTTLPAATSSDANPAAVGTDNPALAVPRQFPDVVRPFGSTPAAPVTPSRSPMLLPPITQQP